MRLSELIFYGGKSLKRYTEIQARSFSVRMPDDVNMIYLRVMSGGGAGGAGGYLTQGNRVAGGGGGESGKMLEVTLSVTPGKVYPVVVGGPGEPSSFGNHAVPAGRNGGDAVTVIVAGERYKFPGRGAGNGGDGNMSTGGVGRGGMGGRLYVSGQGTRGSGGDGGDGSVGSESTPGKPGVQGFIDIVYESTGEIIEV